MPVKIVTLMENQRGEHLALKAEHGLSFYVEKDGGKLLFDTGQSGAFMDNADRLGLDLSDLRHVVVSHGHYDHSGGVRPLAERRESFQLVVGPGFFRAKYAVRGPSRAFLGNDFDEDFLRRRGVELRVAAGGREEILPGIHVVTGFPRVHDDEIINPRFRLLRDGALVPDPFDDEVLLAVESSRGTVVLLGCAHPGMKNMLDAVESLFPGPLYAVLGGTHLVEASETSLRTSLAYLKSREIGLVGVSHCTGGKAADLVAATMEGSFPNPGGTEIVID